MRRPSKNCSTNDSSQNPVAPEQTDNHAFRTAYGALERRMEMQAGEDKNVFLPNPEPLGVVDYVFVCMEPSFFGWAKNKIEAEKNVKDGFRNFIAGYDLMILHLCIRRFLCPFEPYHMTDFSKGAMPVANARIGGRKDFRSGIRCCAMRSNLSLLQRACSPSASALRIIWSDWNFRLRLHV